MMKLMVLADDGFFIVRFIIEQVQIPDATIQSANPLQLNPRPVLPSTP